MAWTCGHLHSSMFRGAVQTAEAPIKQRLETVSGVDIQLKGDVAGFTIDRRISGACASDVLKSLCDNYRDKLVCRNEPGRTLIERKP